MALATNRRLVSVIRAVEDFRLGLVAAARAGDKLAFGELAALEGRAAYRLCYGVLRNRPDAEDAVQDAFVQAWSGLPGLKDLDRWPAWFRRLVVNAAIDTDRRRRRRPTVQLIDIAFSTGDATGGVVERDEVDRLMASLSAGDRAVVVLRYQQDLELPAIADALDIPLGTAKARLHRALKKIRKNIQPELGEPYGYRGSSAR